MGIVKFNNTSLNIEQVPDGHVIITQAELDSISSLRNELNLIKSYLPPGVDKGQLGGLVEKGQRFDPLNTEHQTLKSQVTDLTAKLSQYSNLPKEFSVEKWNSYVNKEQMENRNVKLNELTQRALAKAKEVVGVDVKVDQRFIPSDVLQNFDVNAPDAQDKWYKVLDDAHTKQQEFIKENLNNVTPVSTPVGAGGSGNGQQATSTPPMRGTPAGDVVSDTGLSVQKFGATFR